MLVLDGVRFAEWRAAHAGTWSILIEHVTAVVAAALLLVIWMAVGATLRHRLDRNSDQRTMPAGAAVLVDAMLGAGVLALLLLLLSALGLLWPSTVLGLTGALAVGLRSELTVAVRRLRDGLATLNAPTRILGSVAVVVALVPALIPPMDWDTLMYHLRLPLGALANGGFRTPADAVAFDALIGVAHLASLPLVALGALEAPAVLHVLLLPLVIAGTVSLARSLHPDASRLVVAAILLGSPALILVAWSGRIDVIFTAAVLAAHLAALHGVRRGTTGSLAVAALAAGTAVGVKSLASAYLVALVPLAFLPRRLPARLILRSALLTALACAPWLIKSWLIAGTPLYPLGFDGRFDPWIESLAATVGGSGAMDRSAMLSLSASREPFNLWDAFFSPRNLTIEGEGRYYALSPAILLLPLGALFALRRKDWLIHLLVPVLYLGAIILPASTINLRYLMAVYPALAALTAVAVATAVSRLPRLRPLVIAAVAFIAILPLTNLLEFRWRAIARQADHVLGLESADSFWLNTPSLRSLSDVGASIAAAGAARDTVALLWEARALALPQPTLMDAFNANWALLAQLPAADDCLAGTGVRWVVMGWGGLGYYVDRGAPPAMFRLDAWERFKARCLGDPVHARDGFLAYPVLAAR